MEKILAIREHPELIDQAAQWNHEKWGVPETAYRESMNAALGSKGGIPAWYVIMNEGNIVAGVGVIANDFHKRADLAPNICALYVEEAYRKCGYARTLLTHACQELSSKGIHDVYLITDHTNFYEKCGWTFYGMVEEDSGKRTRMYHKHTV